MALVKCRYCGKKIKKEDAFSIKSGKVFKYYCNEKHSLMKTDEQLFTELALYILNNTTNTYFYKESKEVSKVHGYKKMYAYLDENKNYLNYIFDRKIFNTEFAKIKYFFAILKNSLNDYQIKEDKEEMYDFTDFKMYKSKKKRTKENLGLDAILNEIVE